MVAVFAQGYTWQFKDWPFPDTVAIFANVRGFFVRFSDETSPEMVQKSDLKTLVLSKEQSKRYLDAPVVKEFWNSLERFILQAKRHLLSAK